MTERVEHYAQRLREGLLNKEKANFLCFIFNLNQGLGSGKSLYTSIWNAREHITDRWLEEFVRLTATYVLAGGEITEMLRYFVTGSISEQHKVSQKDKFERIIKDIPDCYKRELAGFIGELNGGKKLSNVLSDRITQLSDELQVPRDEIPTVMSALLIFAEQTPGTKEYSDRFREFNEKEGSGEQEARNALAEFEAAYLKAADELKKTGMRDDDTVVNYCKNSDSVKKMLEIAEKLDHFDVSNKLKFRYLAAQLGMYALVRDKGALNKKLDEVLSLLKRTVEAFPQEYYPHAILGEYLIIQGEGEAGLEHLNTAYDLAPTYEEKKESLNKELQSNKTPYVQKMVLHYLEEIKNPRKLMTKEAIKGLIQKVEENKK